MTHIIIVVYGIGIQVATVDETEVTHYLQGTQSRNSCFTKAYISKELLSPAGAPIAQNPVRPDGTSPVAV